MSKLNTKKELLLDIKFLLKTFFVSFLILLAFSFYYFFIDKNFIFGIFFGFFVFWYGLYFNARALGGSKLHMIIFIIKLPLLLMIIFYFGNRGSDFLNFFCFGFLVPLFSFIPVSFYSNR